MRSLKNLLAATDLSPFSHHAADVAARLAARSGARLILMHVVNQSNLRTLRAVLGRQSTAVMQQLMDQLRDELQQLAQNCGEAHGVTPSLNLVRGGVLREIASHADALDADLLVLGARGAGPLRHLALGSTAERLLRMMRRPVLVVKQPARDYRRILIPVDFSAWSQQSLQLAQIIAPDAELTLFHAVDVPFEGMLHLAGIEEKTIEQYRIDACREALDRLHQLTSAMAGPVGKLNHIVMPGDATVSIMEQAARCDLIVVGKHGGQMFKELLIGSVTKHILGESACDVLVVAH